GRIVADVQFHGLDAELAQGLSGLEVLALRTAHRGVHGVAGVAQGLRRIAAEAAAGAGDQDCFGHSWLPLCVCCCHCGGAGWAGAAGSGCGVPARSARRIRIAAVLMARVSSAMAAATRNARANPVVRAWW